jgi:predicted flap endonuclease-1-like 5' DNA nuclease
MTLKTYNEWRREQAPSFLEEAEEYMKWVEEKEEKEQLENRTIELTEQEWLEIKGIGPKLAKRLVESSPIHFENIEQVKGIKTSVLENIKDYLLEKSIL